MIRPVVKQNLIKSSISLSPIHLAWSNTLSIVHAIANIVMIRQKVLRLLNCLNEVATYSNRTRKYYLDDFIGTPNTMVPNYMSRTTMAHIYLQQFKSNNRKGWIADSHRLKRWPFFEKFHPFLLLLALKLLKINVGHCCP